MWHDVIGKSKTEVSYRSYLVGNDIMINHQVDKHTLAVSGAWMNVKGTTENNIPFKAHELMECLSKIVHEDSSQPQINHLIGDGDVCIRMVTHEGQLKIIRRFRCIVIDISTPQKFEEFRQDCLRSYEVMLVLQDRHRQRRRLTTFLVDNPSPCSCIGGGANHLRHYYYSSAVSNFGDILPLEFVFKQYAS